MPRRTFLARIGLGAATAAVAADALLAYRAYDQGVLAEGRGPAFDAWTAWRSMTGPEAMVGAALLAASAHNTQPWRFHIRADRVDLWTDPARSTGTNDPFGRERLISLGCALENLIIAAMQQGASPSVELLPSGPGDRLVAVSLGSSAPRPSELYDAIGRRRTNRSVYRPGEVPVAMLESMRSLADETTASAQLSWLTGASARGRFGWLLVEATRAHVADDQQSRDSFAWWRSDRDQTLREKDGLSIDGVGLPPLTRTIAKLLPAPSRSEADRTFIERTQLQAFSASAFGVVTVDDPYDPHDQLTGGRLLQRVHLWATANGLGFQHMNQITERIDRDRQLGVPSGFLDPLVEVAGAGALAAFRIGYPTVGAIASARRPIGEVVR